MIVLVDMDNTTVDFDYGGYQIVTKAFPGSPVPTRFAHSSFADNFPEQMRAVIKQAYTEPGFFLNLPPIDGALRALREMQQEGIDVYICTSPLSTFQNCINEKLIWVSRYLGPDWVRRVILTKDKTLVRGDILIDDRPEVSRGAMQPTWEHVLYDQPYNQHTMLRRINHWRDWPYAVYGFRDRSGAPAVRASS